MVLLYLRNSFIFRNFKFLTFYNGYRQLLSGKASNIECLSSFEYLAFYSRFWKINLEYLTSYTIFWTMLSGKASNFECLSSFEYLAFYSRFWKINLEYLTSYTIFWLVLSGKARNSMYFTSHGIFWTLLSGRVNNYKYFTSRGIFGTLLSGKASSLTYMQWGLYHPVWHSRLGQGTNFIKQSDAAKHKLECSQKSTPRSEHSPGDASFAEHSGVFYDGIISSGILAPAFIASANQIRDDEVVLDEGSSHVLSSRSNFEARKATIQRKFLQQNMQFEVHKQASRIKFRFGADATAEAKSNVNMPLLVHNLKTEKNEVLRTNCHVLGGGCSTPFLIGNEFQTRKHALMNKDPKRPWLEVDGENGERIRIPLRFNGHLFLMNVCGHNPWEYTNTPAVQQVVFITQHEENQRVMEQINEGLANFRRHKHSRVPLDERSKYVLSVDIAGPLPRSIDGKKYFMVGAWTSATGRRLPFVRNLTDRSNGTVSLATLSIIAEVNLHQGNAGAVLGVHTDRDAALMSMGPTLTRVGVKPTTTQGYDPASNGSAETYVGIIKAGIRRRLVNSGMPVRYWSFAAHCAAYAGRHPDRELPEFGEHILCRYKKTDNSLTPQAGHAIFLAPATDVRPAGIIVEWKKTRKIEALVEYKRFPSAQRLMGAVDLQPGQAESPSTSVNEIDYVDFIPKEASANAEPSDTEQINQQSQEQPAEMSDAEWLEGINRQIQAAREDQKLDEEIEQSMRELDDGLDRLAQHVGATRYPTRERRPPDRFSYSTFECFSARPWEENLFSNNQDVMARVQDELIPIQDFIASETVKNEMSENAGVALAATATETKSMNVTRVARQLCCTAERDIRTATAKEIKARDTTGPAWDASKRAEFEGLAANLERVQRSEMRQDGVILPWTVRFQRKRCGKLKTRGCLCGNIELKLAPNRTTLATASPTASRLAAMIARSIAVSLDLAPKVADIPQAFLKGCKAEWRKRWEKYPVYVEMPSQRQVATHLLPESMRCNSYQILKITGPIYGLSDAALQWFNTIVRDLKNAKLADLKVIQSKIDNCLFWFMDADGRAKGYLLIHVDDLEFAIQGDNAMQAFEEFLRAHGVKEIQDSRISPTEYCGKTLQYQNGELIIDQTNYMESIEPLDIDDSANDNTPVTQPQRREAQAVLGQLAWLAVCTLPDLSVVVSYALSDLSSKGDISVLKFINKQVANLPKKASIRVKSLELPWMLLSYGDCSFGLKSQGGRILGIVSANQIRKLSNNTAMRRSKFSTCEIDFNVIDWQSARVRRVVRSTYAGESAVASAAVDNAFAARAILVEGGWGEKMKVIHTIDAASVIAAVKSAVIPSNDKRTAIDISILKEGEAQGWLHCVWLPTDYMMADGMTKVQTPLQKIIRAVTQKAAVPLPERLQ